MSSSVTMSAYTWTPPVGRNRLPTPQQTSCRRLPSPTMQTQYYSPQQRTSSQQNNQQSCGLWNTHSFSQPVSSPSNFQSSQAPQAWFTGSQNQLLHRTLASARTTTSNCTGNFALLPAAQFGTPTENLSHHPQTSHRNTASHENYNMPPLQNVNTATVLWFPTVSSNASSAFEENNLRYRSVPPQYQPLNGHHNRMQITNGPAAQPQQTALTVQTAHTAQRIYNNQGQIRGVENGASYSSATQSPAASQRPMVPSVPSHYRCQNGQNQSSYNRNQVQNSSQIQRQYSPYRAENSTDGYSQIKYGASSTSILPQPPSYRSQHFVIQSQPNQRINQSSTSSLPQDNVQPHTHFFGDLLEEVQSRKVLQQCNTVLISGQHSKTSIPTLPAIQGNTQPGVLQSNNTMTGLSRTFQDTHSYSTPTSEAPPPTYTESNNCSQVSLFDLLLEKDNTQVPVQKHGTNPLSCLKLRFENCLAESGAEPQQTTQGQTAGHVTAMAGSSETISVSYCSVSAPLGNKEQRVSEYQAPAKRTAILRTNKSGHGNQLQAPDVESFKGVQSSRLQIDSHIERSNGDECSTRHGEVQCSKDPADSLELVKALQSVVRQAHRAVAVVPPISQRASSPGENYVTTSSDDSLPFKIDAFWTLVKDSENMEQESTAPSLPKVTIDDLLKLFSVQHPERQESNKSGNGSTIDTPTSGSQSIDIPQSENNVPTKFQDPICSTDLTSKSPVEQEDYQKLESYSNDNTLDLSKVQVLNFTLNKLNYIVKFLEATPAGRVKEPITDVEKHIMDLFYDGDTKNIVKQINTFTAELLELSSEVTAKEMHTKVFEYLEPKDLKMLAYRYHVLKDETTLPAEEFRSSWLNIDGQPVDIENVLAEPILDCNLTDPEEWGFAILKGHSESEHSREIFIPATSNCQNDMSLNKELSNSEVCESKFPNQVFNTQETSKKQEDTEQHEQQDVNINSEEFVHSDKIPDTLSEVKNQTEYENKLSRDTSEDIFFSPETDISTDADSSNDSQLIELTLLSSNDARTIFGEYSDCDLQKEPPQLCQDETKVLDTFFLSQPDHESNKGELVSHNPPSCIKFTCPHVTAIDCDGEHFCPRCLEEAPLLDLDLEEALLSPKGSSPNMRASPKRGDQRQSCSPQSGELDQNVHVCPESSSIINSSNPSTVGVNMTITEPAPNPGDSRRSCSSQSVKSPVCTDNGSFTMLISEQVCEIKGSFGKELSKALLHKKKVKKGKPVDPYQTKRSREKVSPPRYPPFKKIKVPKTRAIPAEDNLFSPDILIKKSSTQKPCPSDHSVASIDDDQHCKNERKEDGEERRFPIKKIQLHQHLTQTKTDAHRICEKPSVQPQVPNVTPQPKGPAFPANSNKSQEKGHDGTIQPGQNNGTKKVRFALYGSNKRNGDGTVLHQCKGKSSTAPVYITVSNSPDTGKRYTDVPSAKQKVYRQWSSMFVEVKQNTSSYKKHEKCEKGELKSRIPSLFKTKSTLKRGR